DVMDLVVFPLRWFGRDGGAGDQTQPLGSGIDAVALEDAPNAVLRDSQSTPQRTSELRGDPGRTKARMSQRKGYVPFLKQDRDRVGHPGRPTFSRTKNLQAEPDGLPMPSVIRGVVDPKRSTGRSNAAKLFG